MIDRGIIKWQPFNSVDTKAMIKEINQQKNRLSFPTLSEDQLKIIGEKIITAYNLKLIIEITYFYDGKIKKIQGKINYLNNTKKILELNKNVIYFPQILKICEL